MPSRLKKLLVLTVAILFIQMHYVKAEEAGWTKTLVDYPHLKAIENSPWGIFVGEDFRNQTNNPYNGVFLSTDLGNSWKMVGLARRGITDLKYFDNKVYATAYYSTSEGSGGLFVTEDRGISWERMGPSFSGAKIDRDSKSIYYGGYSRGLWVSFDGGETFEQKIGEGIFGPDVRTIESTEDLTLVSAGDDVFLSKDHGVSWTEIPALRRKGVGYFVIDKNVLIAGTYSIQGIYISKDSGVTWKILDPFYNIVTLGMVKLDHTYFVAYKTRSEGVVYVLKSTDLISWEDTKLQVPNQENIYELIGVHSDPKYIFAAGVGGILKYEVPKDQTLTNPIFNAPWNIKNERELVDKISAFFDHSYPFLGYPYHREPDIESNTTLNFFGNKEKEPEIYYSSHNGTDYALPYGTEIKAVSSGYARYYNCSSCGHTIIIEHQTGYETTYLHLQKDGLITRDTQTWVTAGETIGKVGMTGNTTGPHLHFGVNDLNKNLPTDPYGWWDGRDTKDPWSIYTWSDSSGDHTGMESEYLWKDEIHPVSSFISSKGGTVTMENTSIVFETSTNRPNITFFLKPYARPIVEKLIFISGTSMIMDAIDQTGKTVRRFVTPAKLIVNFAGLNVSQIIPETLSLYRWDSVEKLWVSVTTLVDHSKKLLTANIDHLSRFAVMGKAANGTVPTTLFSITGESDENKWFIQYPTISLSSGIIGDTIFYSNEEGDFWKEYRDPFLYDRDGITTLSVRTLSSSENLEKKRSIVLKVNTKGARTKTLKVGASVFGLN